MPTERPEILDVCAREVKPFDFVEEGLTVYQVEYWPLLHRVTLHCGVPIVVRGLLEIQAGTRDHRVLNASDGVRVARGIPVMGSALGRLISVTYDEPQSWSVRIPTP